MHLATATGTPDSSGGNLRMAHTCRMNAVFQLGGALQFGGGNRMRPERRPGNAWASAAAFQSTMKERLPAGKSRKVLPPYGSNTAR